MDPAEFSRLLDLYDNNFRNIAEGEVVKGTVLKVTENEVVVDVGYKSEGVISVNEFLDETGAVMVQPGDVVDVLLERTEDRDGHIVLSREKAEKMKIWDEVEKAFADRKVVIGRVIERIKGGLAVDLLRAADGRTALLPSDFSVAFVVIGAIAVASMVSFFRLAPDAGSEVSGHRPGGGG